MSKKTTSMAGATLVTRSMSTMSSNEAARTSESPKVSTAQRMTALAGARLEAVADRGQLLSAQRLVAHVGLGHRSLTFSHGAIGPSRGARRRRLTPVRMQALVYMTKMVMI